MKNLLVINHFPTVKPPISGGTLRYFHLYQELSKYYHITLLSQSWSHKSGLFQYSPTFNEYKVEKDHLYNKMTDSNNRQSYEFTLINHMTLSYQDTIFKKYFNNLYQTSDIIIHESPYLLGYDQFIGLDGKLRIYNSHNHEYLLAKKIWMNEKAKEFLPILYEEEKKLVENADIVFATSENERQSFISMYRKDPKQVKLAPNGIHPDVWLKKTTRSHIRTRAIFIGSDYLPNIEAVNFIINQLADKCPDIDFVIAGGCCNPFLTLKKSNVQFLGRILHKQKLTLFAEANIALNPIMTGAGVNLKTLEFLSAGIPLFSTEFGIRGLELTDHKHYFHVDRENFSDKLNNYHQNEEILNEVSTGGQKYINANFSWSSIAKGIYEEIEGY
ncbi:glycosyltransferase involved in cell wall biosynthesis [Bacillus sp. SORGH_AS 510]|uniref:glycosyltransferase family 4 protein n=1 Tax=Bacillus sp. SORGH_AS_0510 TaxID=3041771 RepID=UPI0027891432|nr:glycosyltransferase family 4 protein [Bacillus sp. SORGH_AS_0510]MDQ1145923.1 glycosyltransferase involved in cell wall biosynthesis [Bacillus sp. SORGH_AS_0510]